MKQRVLLGGLETEQIAKTLENQGYQVTRHCTFHYARERLILCEETFHYFAFSKEQIQNNYPETIRQIDPRITLLNQHGQEINPREKLSKAS